ncbi:MAG: transketolase, partial [Alphaproteobacteria bacterium]|nr:transketolase [Alphaproteobacteria bacterium]
MTHDQITELSNCLRFLSMDMVEKAQSGHPGMPMGMADVVTVLYKQFIQFNPKDPQWDGRDRFVLSGGHGSALLYSLLYLTGYDRPNMNDLMNFRKLGSPCAGHPEYTDLPGIEATTGPLGQGIANAVGMAIAAQKKHATYDQYPLSKVYVTCGDGDLMEGISHEACSLAGHLGLNNLIILFDDNHITIDGAKNLSDSENTLVRFEAYGFHTLAIDGHNYEAIHNALLIAQKAEKPTLIACRTIIGKGAPNKAGTAKVHGSPLGAQEIQLTRHALNWQHEPFHIPPHLKQQWEGFAKRCMEHYEASKNHRFDHKQSDVDVHNALEPLKLSYIEQRTEKATREISQDVLGVISPLMPELVGGSADLTPSNNTFVSSQDIIARNQYKGHYIHYGVREHAMAAVMNGLCLSGFKAYGGTFLAFSDYMRPAIRLSALMHLRVIYVMTHDSIGLGEDGPTHQPIEHLASLRAMPNVHVYRPCDAVEALECWALALESKDHPSILALSRQKLKLLREKHTTENLCA